MECFLTANKSQCESLIVGYNSLRPEVILLLLLFQAPPQGLPGRKVHRGGQRGAVPLGGRGLQYHPPVRLREEELRSFLLTL